MKLYLARHGDYVVQDLQRRDILSEKGIDEIKKTAHFLFKSGVTFSKIFHSGKIRAKQTAEIYAAALLPNQSIEEMTGIMPTDDITLFLDLVHNWREDTLVVGHLPFMEKLVSHLVVGYNSKPVVTFFTGTIVCLEQKDDLNWSIQWVLAPNLLINNEVI